MRHKIVNTHALNFSLKTLLNHYSLRSGQVVKAYHFSLSQLQKALLAVGALSSLGLSTTLTHANEEQPQQLDTIHISAPTNPVLKESINLTGFHQENLIDIPASISRISAETIANQQAKTLADVVKNDAAVGEGYAPIGYYANFVMRGFYLNLGSSYLMNGNLLRGEQNIALENKQQVEILKGISAIQSGMSTPGGVVNYVTKRPEHIRALTLDADSYGGHRIAADMGDFFGTEQQFGYRLNLAKEQMHPNVEHAIGQRLFGSLALDWKVSDRSKLEFDIESQRQRQRSVPGYQLLDNATVPSDVSWDRLLGYQSWTNPVTNTSLNSNLKFSHQINDLWNAYANASQSRTVVDDYSAFPWGCYDAICQSTGFGNTFDQNGYYDLYDYHSPNDSYLSNQFKTGLNGQFATGDWQHQLNVELTHTYKRHAQYDAVNEWIGTGNIHQNVGDVTPTTVSLGNHYKSLDSKQTSLNISDLIDLNAEWSVLAGGKLLHLNEQAFDATQTQLRDTDINRFLPQLALMYQPWQGTHIYASYAKGLSDGGQAPWFANNNFETLAPIYSTQYELGLKQQWQTLLFTAALFDLTQDHQYTNTALDFVTQGEQHNLGLELGLQGNVSPNLELASSVAITRARLKGTNTLENEGHQAQNVPKLRFANHLTYRVAQVEGLKLLAGMQYSGRKNANKLGNVSVPSYTLFDLGAIYQFKTNDYAHSVRLNVENVLNKKYWRDAGAYFGDDYLFLGTPRTAQLSWTVNF